MDIKRKIHGTVVKLQCSSCGRTFSHFLFSAEGDADSAGLHSLSSCKKNEIVLGEMESNEWNNLDSGGILVFEARLSKHLGRDDLRATHLLRVGKKNGTATGVNFRDFMKTYQPPIQVFSCIFCAGGESKSTEETTIKEFLSTGGCISEVGQLDLQDGGSRDKQEI